MTTRGMKMCGKNEIFFGIILTKIKMQSPKYRSEENNAYAIDYPSIFRVCFENSTKFYTITENIKFFNWNMNWYLTNGHIIDKHILNDNICFCKCTYYNKTTLLPSTYSHNVLYVIQDDVINYFTLNIILKNAKIDNCVYTLYYRSRTIYREDDNMLDFETNLTATIKGNYHLYYYKSLSKFIIISDDILFDDLMYIFNQSNCPFNYYDRLICCPKYDWKQMREIFYEFAKEIIEYAFHPNRIARMANYFQMSEMEYMECI